MTVFYWQHIDALWSMSATFLAMAGIALIYRSWRWQRRAGLIPGWGLLVLSLAGWTVAGTAWIGLPVGLSLLMLLFIIWIAAQGQWPSRTAVSSGQRAENLPAKPMISHHLWQRGLMRLLVAGPLAAVLALTSSVLLGQLTTGNDRLFTERLAVTVLWTLGMAWACTSHKIRVPAITLATLSAIAFISLLALR